ncbi:MAG: AAA family ATPase [bacterium]|nr:AAA family ATPase [bacterium]
MEIISKSYLSVSTTLNAIIAVMKNRGLKFALSAPTGRAAKRITELTGYEAKTIHRLLEVEWLAEEGRHRFARNERNPLDFDVIIIDEMSMVDVCLFDELLKAVRLGGRIILVGDSDQLPSVSAGNVLRDIIESAKFKTVMLKKIFRQSLDSLITVNAHKINAGEYPEINNKSSDFFMIESKNPVAAARLIVELYTKRLPQAYDFLDGNSVQVLCPSKLRELGTINLNNMLQHKINPGRDDRKEILFEGTVFRVGDRVMQVKNNYDIELSGDDGSLSIGVFNGDIGFIEDIDFSLQTVNIRFDNKVAEYQFSEMHQIELAYAVTVHKSQGSEFDCVILPLLDFPLQLRYRNLLYTAITRAKKLLIVVGSQQMLIEMIKNDRKTLRYTGLCGFLRGNNDPVN